MPSRRNNIELSAAEIREFLDSQKTLIIVSNGKDGYPHPMPMWFYVDDEDCLYCTTFGKSQKILNWRRDPKASSARRERHRIRATQRRRDLCARRDHRRPRHRDRHAREDQHARHNRRCGATTGPDGGRVEDGREASGDQVPSGAIRELGSLEAWRAVLRDSELRITAAVGSCWFGHARAVPGRSAGDIPVAGWPSPTRPHSRLDRVSVARSKVL